MRKSFYTLSRLIRTKMGKDPLDGSMRGETEAEHVAAILKSRAKRKESASNFAELHKTLQTPPNCAKLRRNPIETYMCLAGRFQTKTCT